MSDKLSPLAQMARALRDKTEEEWKNHPSYRDPRVQNTEWGPMEEVPEQWCAKCGGSGWGRTASDELCPLCEGAGRDQTIQVLLELLEAYQKSVISEDWDIQITRKVTAVLSKAGAL